MPLAVLALALMTAMVGPAPQDPSSPSSGAEVVAAVRVHGNQLTADDELVNLTGITVGVPVTPALLTRVHDKLVATGRFRDVQVLKRFASVADPSQILIVVIVDEGPVTIRTTDDPQEPVRVVRRRGLSNVLWAPLLDAEEGYGLTYGVRLTWLGLGGERGRVSVPLSWGASKRAALEYERGFTAGPITRLQVHTSLQSDHSPAFLDRIERADLWTRAERKMGWFRVAGALDWARVRFQDLDQMQHAESVEFIYDTRLDPVLPRNAIFASLAVQGLHVEGQSIIVRTNVDARAYAGVIGQNVVVARVTLENANGPLPPYLKPLLGGWANLRGFEPGAFIGDRLLSGSLELRVPLTSPLRLGRIGVSVFVDSGKVAAYDQSFREQPLHTGAGAGAWYTVTAVKIGVGVAHAVGCGTRMTFGAELSF